MHGNLWLRSGVPAQAMGGLGWGQSLVQGEGMKGRTESITGLRRLGYLASGRESVTSGTAGTGGTAGTAGTGGFSLSPLGRSRHLHKKTMRLS